MGGHREFGHLMHKAGKTITYTLDASEQKAFKGIIVDGFINNFNKLKTRAFMAVPFAAGLYFEYKWATAKHIQLQKDEQKACRYV